MVRDADRFKHAPWINSVSGAGLFDLNANTTRRAVGCMLAFVRSHPTAPGQVSEDHAVV